MGGVIAVLFMLFSFASPAHALIDTYHESFDNRQDGATIDGVDSWIVTSGSANHAEAMSGSTATGSGKSLKVMGAPTTVDVSRPDQYGNLTPTWIEYVVKPGLGRAPRNAPTSGIGAICFNSDGKILATDGGTWVPTGLTFESDKWYRVIQKLNFTDHVYDLYVSPADIPKSPFSPDKQNLHFTTATLGSMSRFGIKGSYNGQGGDSTYLDDLIIHTIDKIQFTTNPQTIVDGYASNGMTVQLQNISGEAQTAWTDLTLELKSSSVNGEFSIEKDPWKAVSQVIIPQGANSVQFYYKDTTVAKPMVTVSETPERGWTDGIQEESVVGKGQFFQVSIPSPQVAGRPFSVEIIAKDANGQADPFYNGSVDIFATYVNPDTGNRVLTPEAAGPFVQGKYDAVLTYSDAGTISVTVRDRDDSSKLGASANVTFVPDHFELNAEEAQKTSKPFALEVRAVGADGLPTANYRGPATLAAVVGQTQPGTLSPNLISGEFSAGVASVSATYDFWGPIKISAADQAFPDHAGLSEEIRFWPSKIKVEARPPSVSRAFFYRGEKVDLDVQVLDANNKPIPNYEGSVKITSEPDLEGLLPEVVLSAVDKGKKTVDFTASVAGTFNISAAEAVSGLKAETGEFDVVEATVIIESKAAPVGTTEVILRLVDSKGRLIRDSAARITILVEEENPNSTIFISEPGKPVLFDKGLARIVIGDSEAETVTIGAQSDMGFKIRKGSVTFGRVGAGGVGTLMLRESKDDDEKN